MLSSAANDLDTILAERPSFDAESFATVSVDDLLNEPIVEQPWLVDELLPDGGFSYLIGRDKSGKSTFCLELMLCVARGEPFLGRTTQQGLVIYLALEGIRGQFAEHFRRMGVLPADGENLIFHHGTTLPADQIAALEHEIRATGAALVVIDTLAKFYPDVNLLNYNKLNKALADLYSLGQRTGCHILILHHASKAAAEKGIGALLAGGGLGSAAFGGSVDTKMAIHKNDETGVVVTQSENRYGTSLPRSRLIFNPETKRLTIGADSTSSELDEKITAYLVGQPKATEMEIKRACGGNQTHTALAIRRLKETGHLISTGAGRKGDPYRYEAPGGSQALQLPEEETPIPIRPLTLVAETT